MKSIVLLMYAIAAANCQFHYVNEIDSYTDDEECELSALPPKPNSQCCGVDSSSSFKIVGGDQTNLRQYPWLALIEYKSALTGKKSTRCGGFLISGRYVLTAAHCVYAPTHKFSIPVNVRLGDYDSNNVGPDCILTEHGEKDCIDAAVTIPIDKITVHAWYTPTKKWNDIALIRLRHMANYTDTIRPICLPSSDIAVEDPKNLRLYAAGWGYINQTKQENGDYDNVRSSLKHYVDLPYQNIEACMRPSRKLYTKKQICAGGETGKDVCNGDSGGPLMRERDEVFEAVGIVSYGPSKPCGQKDTPGVYTKVFAYRDWIMGNILSFD